MNILLKKAGGGATTKYNKQEFIATADQKVFDLDYSPISNSVFCFVNGVLQAEGDEYTISETTVTFAEGISLGWKVLFCYAYN